MKLTRAFLIATFGGVILTACGSKTDPSEKNFGAALNQYLEKKGALCLRQRWPVELSQWDLESEEADSRLAQMNALEKAGLVRGEESDVKVSEFRLGSSGPTAKIKRFSLTNTAKPFVRESNLCWGQKALDRVVKWEGPLKLGDYQEAAVTYTYQIDKLSDWAQRPDVLAAFPHIRQVLDGAGKKEARHSIKLTSQGWEALGLD